MVPKPIHEFLVLSPLLNLTVEAPADLFHAEDAEVIDRSGKFVRKDLTTFETELTLSKSSHSYQQLLLRNHYPRRTRQ